MPLSSKLERGCARKPSPRKIACPICGGQCGREFEFDSKFMEVLFVFLCRFYKLQEEAALLRTLASTTSDMTLPSAQQQGYPGAHQSLDLLGQCPQPLSDDQLAQDQLCRESEQVLTGQYYPCGNFDAEMKAMRLTPDMVQKPPLIETRSLIFRLPCPVKLIITMMADGGTLLRPTALMEVSLDPESSPMLRWIS